MSSHSPVEALSCKAKRERLGLFKLREGFCLALVSVIVSSYGHDMSIYMVVAKILHHCSCPVYPAAGFCEYTYLVLVACVDGVACPRMEPNAKQLRRS